MTGLREERSRSLHGELFDDDRPSPVDFSTASSDAALHAPGTRRHQVDVSDALIRGRSDSFFTDADLAADFTSDLADDVLAPPVAFSAPSIAAPAPRDPLIETAPKSGGGGGGGQDGARGGGGGDAGTNATTARPRAVVGEFAVSRGGGSLSVTTQTSGNPPTAVPDEYPVDYRGTVSGNVKLNDLYGDSFTMTASLVSGPSDPAAGPAIPDADGGFEWSNTGEFTYAAPDDWDLSDSFTYAVSNEYGSTTATVTLTWANGAPWGENDEYAALADAPLVVSEADGVLANDFDYDKTGFPTSPRLGLEAVKVSDGAHGFVDLNPNGSFTYTPTDPDWYGTDVFEYRLFDTLDGQLAMADWDVTQVEIEVHDLRIFHSGIDVTANPGETVVGKKVNLSLNVVNADGVVPLPAANFQNVQWTIPGVAGEEPTAITNYEISLQEGKVTKLAATDLDDQTVGFYWIDGSSDGSDTKNVIVSARLQFDGRLYNTHTDGNLVVWEPHIPDAITYSTNPFTLKDGSDDGDIVVSLGEHLNQNKKGIEWTGTIKAPPSYSGEIAFIQLLSGFMVWIKEDGTQVLATTTGHGVVLDRLGNIPQYQDEIVAVSPGEVKTVTVYDTPVAGTNAEDSQRLAFGYNFQDFLMFKPTGTDSIWVTVRKMRWETAAQADNIGHVFNDWQLTSSKHPDNPAPNPPPNAEIEQGLSSQLPVWTARWQVLSEQAGF